MTSYRLDEVAIQSPYEPPPTPSMDRLLDQQVSILCNAEGISSHAMTSIQRMFLTHYRCSACKLLPLYRLDLSHIKRARCGRCGQLVSFTTAGKYGKMRKKLAVMLWEVTKGGGGGGGKDIVR